MSKRNDLSEAPSVKPILDAIGEDSPDVKEQIAEEITKVHEDNHLSGAGALTDVVAPQKGDPELRRETNRLAILQDDIPDPRRRTIAALLGTGLVLPIISGSIAGYIATLSAYDQTRPDTVSESFLKEILRIRDDKTRLRDLSKHYLSQGDTDKSIFLKHISASGESFKETDESLDDLGQLLASGKLSEFSEVFIRREYGHHYRYLGCYDAARREYEKIKNYKTSDRLMNTLLINSKHMTSHTELYGKPAYSRMLSADNRELTKSFRECFDADIEKLSTAAFHEARNVSLECAALKGLFFSNIVMAAATEVEALEALRELDEFSDQMFATIDFSQDPRRIIREYGEVIWWYGRVAKIALLKSWDNVVHRCLSSFYNPSSNDNRKVILNRDFHLTEAEQLRSPIWISTALVRALWQEVESGQGDRELTRLIPVTRAHMFKPSPGLQRAYNALSVAFGEDSMNVDPKHALAAIEDLTLVDCVDKMCKRCRKP